MSRGSDALASRLRPGPGLLEVPEEIARPRGRNLLERTGAYARWQDRRCESGLCPFPNSPAHAPECTPKFRHRSQNGDLDFSTRDPLGLAASELVHQAAARSVRAAGLQAPADLSRALEEEVCEWLAQPHVVLFESSLDARLRSVAALLQREDAVILGRGVDPILGQAASEATSHVYRYDHLDAEELRAQLCEIRGRSATQGILVVTQGLFPLDSHAPDLPRLQALCREYQAHLLVDTVHDLGVCGPEGTGQLGAQSMLDEVDLVIGGFAGALVSNVGFLATRSREVAEFVKFRGGVHVAPTGPSAIQCAVASEALRVSRSGDGERLREEIASTVDALREELGGRRVPCLGQSSPYVVVHLGWEGGARLVSSLLVERRIFANLLEHPLVPPGSARLSLQVPARMLREHAVRTATALSESVRGAWELVARR